MAKSYKKGADYRLYLNTGTRGTPTWAEIKACGDITVSPQPDDIEVPERGIGTGHLFGELNPQITFTLFEDSGDTNVETMLAAMFSGAMLEIAVARGAIATTGVKWVRLESVLMGENSAARGDVGQWDVTAQRHANSDYDLTRTTT